MTQLIERSSRDERIPDSRLPLDYAGEVRLRAREELEVFAASIRPDGETYKSRIFQSNRSTGTQIAADYGRRFLVELIQNGHDAHPDDEQMGRLAVLLAPLEGEHGTLYVANCGRSFTSEDSEALCNLGGSNKLPGESIGNKGLGFRSVTHVTDDPQVYSRADRGSGDHYDGYCFHFAQDADLDELIENPSHLALAKKDLPLFHIPVPLTGERPARVRHFAAQGFATVIRLPLKSREALDIAEKEIALLRTGPAPLLLFLKRLTSVSVTVEGQPDATYVLQRASQTLDLAPTGIPEALDRFDVVALGSLGKYFVAWRTLPHADVVEAIAASTELSERWKDWRGDGEVAVAAPPGGRGSHAASLHPLANGSSISRSLQRLPARHLLPEG